MKFVHNIKSNYYYDDCSAPEFYYLENDDIKMCYWADIPLNAYGIHKSWFRDNNKNGLITPRELCIVVHEYTEGRDVYNYHHFVAYHNDDESNYEVIDKLFHMICCFEPLDDVMTLARFIEL